MREMGGGVSLDISVACWGHSLYFDQHGTDRGLDWGLLVPGTRPGFGWQSSPTQAARAPSLRLLAHTASWAPPPPTADVSCSRTQPGRGLPGTLIVPLPRQPQMGGRQLWFPAPPPLTFKYRFGRETDGWVCNCRPERAQEGYK